MTSTHHWKFFRTGGLDHVSLETGADLLALDQLDQKLWVALSCPVRGLELDEGTLAMIDSDGDGRIRVPELLAAVRWAATRLKDPGLLLRGEPALPLAAIDDATPEGRTLLASARRILASLGKPEADRLTPAESGDTAAIFAASALNGDGVIPPEATEDPAAQALIKDIITCLGGVRDRTSAEGVTAEKIERFFDDLAAYAAWVEQSAAKEIAVLGESTDAAVAALRAVRPKVEDFFGRCRLAAFDPRATGALNRAESDYLAVAAKDLRITADEMAGFPLARVEAGRPLPLLAAVNPAWAAALADLQRLVVAPVLGADKDELTERDWAALQAKFAPYETWLGGKAGSTVEKLGLPRVREILTGRGRDALEALVARDRALEPQYRAISDVNRLAHYHRDLRALLHSFVNFGDFYSRERYAAFQAGVLYLDSRCTELCVRVGAPHPLAAMSRAYIVYCDCRRAGSETMKIAACLTQGDSDYLFVGRNGIFYDRQGRDWDAVVTSIVDNPIGLRQAFWLPYKKLVRMIEERVAKRAAAADAAAGVRLAQGLAATPPAPAAAPPKVEVGAVAAIGVAVTGALSALTLILGYLFQLRFWQYPLVLGGLLLVISLPSVAIAWLKLRQRTLGPLLEANGWAINGRVRINVPFGRKLTALAEMPPGARRTLRDPYADKSAERRRVLVWILFFALLGAAVWVRWDRGRRGHYYWQESPAAVAPAGEPE